MRLQGGHLTAGASFAKVSEDKKDTKEIAVSFSVTICTDAPNHDHQEYTDTNDLSTNSISNTSSTIALLTHNSTIPGIPGGKTW
jgi:hypothetical protein